MAFRIKSDTYKARLTGIERGLTKNGNAQFIYSFELDDADHTNMKYFQVWTDNTYEKNSNEVLSALKYSGKLSNLHENTDVIGREVKVFVKDNTYNGETNSRITAIFDIFGEYERPAVDDKQFADTIADFEYRMKKKIAAQPQTPASMIHDDNVPF